MKVDNVYFPVLDHGFITLKDYMGADQDIEQAARISCQKGTRPVSSTRGLIRYLVKNKHTGPLEQAELKFHIKAPMYVWRQWIRHRTASVNEISGRYSVIQDEQHKIKPDEWRFQSTTNKQGSDECIEDEEESVQQEYIHTYIYNMYQIRLEKGIAREQARQDLPLSTYTEAFWKIDLHNLLHFLSLRCDSHAQKEIRDYANVIAGIVKKLFPITFEAWEDYVFYAKTLSYQQRLVLNYVYDIIRDNKKEMTELAKSLGMTDREINDLFDIIPPDKEDFALNGVSQNNPTITWE